MNMHVGQIIEQKFQESGIKLSVFAERINTGERNVYSIFKRKDINAGMLQKISEVLDFNFFDLFVPVTTTVTNVVLNNSITIKLEVKVDTQKIKMLPEFLLDVEKIANKQGFKIL